MLCFSAKFDNIYLLMTTMSNAKLNDFSVLVFDVYGTLADWKTGLYNALKPLISRFPLSAGWSKDEAYNAYQESEQGLLQKHPDMLYSDLLAKAHEILEQRLEAESAPIDPTSPLDPGRHALFGDSIKHFPIFPDSSQALHDLAKVYKLVVLSNVDYKSFRHTHAKLSEGSSEAMASSTYSRPETKYWFPQEVDPIHTKSPFTLILTAQDVGSYKPAEKGFIEALKVIQEDSKLLNTPKEKVLWVAQSIYHDHYTARKLGITSVWINRNGIPEPDPKPYKWVFPTLGDFADAVMNDKLSTLRNI
ncbi:haloacid dehalogenase [Mycena floridula]|nr:haloacid dehalogenase [Mycena floridula]